MGVYLRVDEPRTPWANTVAYYPLTANANDYSWNGYNATNYYATFSETNGGYFWTVESRLQLPSMTIWQTFTISCWVKLPNWQPQWYKELDIYFDRSGSYRNLLFSCVENWFYCYNWNNATSHSAKTVSATFWTWWNNIILSKNGTSYSIYKNWVLLETFTSSYNISIPWWNNTVYIWHSSNDTAEYSEQWYIKDYIIENKARTADEISDYYNQTKWDYWIS